MISYRPVYPGTKGSPPLREDIDNAVRLELTHMTEYLLLEAVSINYDYPSDIPIFMEIGGALQGLEPSVQSGRIQF